MKKYFKLILIMMLAVTMLLTFVGCSGQTESELSLSDLETVEYNNPHNGATITIPADWQVQSEDEKTTVFLSSDGTISYLAQWELGGMSYFSKEELAGLAADIGNTVLTDPVVYGSWELTDFDVAVKVVSTGTMEDKAGKSANAVCDASIIQYFNDVRYYLVATTDAGTYAEYENVFMEIAQSFNVSLTEDEVYQKMNEQNEIVEE